MDESTPSRTAQVTALMRALHSRADPFPLLDDPWGERLVPASVRDILHRSVLARMPPDARVAALAAPDSIVDDHLRASTSYAGVIIRSRYAEDTLAQAVNRGTRQYVLIGAGFDSFALRRPPFARDVEIFEIDHAATQALKLQRIGDCGISLPSSVHFIATDLGAEGLASALARSPFRTDRPAFFSWLGVTSYLRRDANLTTLRAVATCGAPGSELVFTYVDQAELASDDPQSRDMRARLASIGEPRLSGFDPNEIARDLSNVGLELVEDLDAGQMSRRYGRNGANALRPRATTHIVLARVA